MKRIAPITGIAMSLFTGSALAADLPMRDQAPFYPAPIFTWTGLYAGINGGLSFGGFTNGGSSFFGSSGGGMVGGTVGYNFQGGPLVVGVEADLDWADINGSASPFPAVSAQGTINETNTVRARLGYSFDRALVYATGGWAGASVSGNLSNFLTTPGLIINQSHYMNGYAVGAGIEYSITPRVSVKAEYLFTALGPNTYFGGTWNAINTGVNYSTVRAGINYHF
ncbi:outer membrane protein [Methyloferula stellata]|uniref:outer membrane protein n=1 Tax=Methyloferula stellata TaxID=876270 RepID=UPI000381D0A7|nr:outer membrane beta-barrel protein [Methyloferula stellata]